MIIDWLGLQKYKLYDSILAVKGRVDRRNSTLNKLHNEIENLKWQNSNTFEYKKNSLQYRMLKVTSSPDIRYNQGWFEVTAKILAAISYVSLMVLLFSSLNLAVNFYFFGTQGGGSPLQNVIYYVTSP